MWTPPAYALLALCLGAWYLASRPSPTAQLAYYYLLWVGLAVGAAGLFFHLRRALRSISSVGKERYRALAAGPPLLLPLAFALFGLFGLAAFHLLR
jgi:Na+-driven multidrug efflux pump